MNSKFHFTLLFSLCGVLLSACGGGVSNATIGGAVSGLGTGLSLTLQDNGGDNLTISSNQSYTFPTSIAPNSGYNVAVLSQPTGETCTVSNGTGSVDSMGDNVGNVSVSCSVTSSLGGTVSGLAQGTSVTLANNGIPLSPALVNGSFAYPGLLTTGSAYSLTVSGQPVGGETCTITSPSIGVILAGTTTTITVVCQ